MRTYLNNRLTLEHGEIIFELDNMKSSYEGRIYELEDSLKELKEELEFKSRLLEEYKTSDTSLAMVHKQREQRLEKRQSVLLLDIDKGNSAVKYLEKENEVLNKFLIEKDEIIQEKTSQIDRLQLVIEAQKETSDQDIETQTLKMSQDILKLKLELDSKSKDNQKLLKEKEAAHREIEKLINLLQEAEKKTNEAKEAMMKQGEEFATKCEQLSIAQYQLELEKRKMTDFQKDLRLREAFTANNNVINRETNNNGIDISRMRGDSMRAQIQFLESRVKLLEERIAMYRTRVRESTLEISEITEDCAKASQLNDRLHIHGTTLVEKLVRDLLESIQTRKDKLESSLDEILRMAPASITKEACELRANALPLKKMAENAKVHDVLVRTSRLLLRIDACEKTKFSNKFLNGERHTSDNKSRRDDTSEKCFTVVSKKPLPNHLLSRPRQTSSALPLWRRKHSFSLDSAQCITPALIDLTLGGSPNNSPSPRDKKTFFPHSSSTSFMDSKSLSGRSGTDSGFRSEY